MKNPCHCVTGTEILGLARAKSNDLGHLVQSRGLEISGTILRPDKTTQDMDCPKIDPENLPKTQQTMLKTIYKVECLVEIV